MKALTVVEAQWLFKKAELEHTPSRAAGITLDDELQRRKTTIQYIESLGLRTGLGHDSAEHTFARGVLTVAAALVHRFYMRRSFTDFNETLMAPTILFLASKIEEEPLKLRHIVNACLNKWDPNAIPWNVDPSNKDNHPHQSREYQAWEREILATEELALEALCFDMGVEQPFSALERFVKAGGTSRLQLEVVELGWPLLNQISYSPIPVLHHPLITAVATFAICIALANGLPLSEGLAAVGEIGTGLGVEVAFDEEKGLIGKDADEIRACCEEIREYSRSGLINEEWMMALPAEPTERTIFVRQFTGDSKMDMSQHHIDHSRLDAFPTNGVPVAS